MKLISTDNVFADVRQMLKSFSSAGLINDADLFRWTQQIISRIGIGQLVEKEMVLDITNYKTNLPIDFNMLIALHRCDLCNEKKGYTTKNYTLGRETRLHLKDWVSITCHSECDSCRNNEEYFISRTIEIEDKEPVTDNFCNKRLLSLNKKVKKDKCHTSCPNFYSKSLDEFNFDNDNIYFNFEEGSAHIQYYANALDEDGYPLIVDNEYISKAIEDYLIYKSLQVIYLNNEGDTRDRMLIYKSEHEKSLKEALNYDKLPTFKKLIDFANEYPKSLEIFNLSSFADGTKTNQYSKRNTTGYF